VSGVALLVASGLAWLLLKTWGDSSRFCSVREFSAAVLLLLAGGRWSAPHAMS
jgi:hypothetical protein